VRSRTAGRINDCVWYLGREESGIYLVEGASSTLIISGGMSYLAPVVLGQIKAFGIKEERIDKLLILHSHFDHVGLVPFFSHRYPHLNLYASERAWEILRMPKGIETINAFSRLVAEKMGFIDGADLAGEEWRKDITGDAISDGSTIDLGSITVQILGTPGHSSCSISAYVPAINALFPSDAGGIPYKNIILPSGNSNFTQYQRSLEKLKPLRVDFLCADHYGYVTGREAKDYVRRSIVAAKEKRLAIEHVFRRTGSIEETVAELVAEIYTQHPDYFLSPEIYAGVCRQTVRHIAGELGNNT
jgi:2-aminobenzoylacetyl-CoA thioesterase